MRPIVTFSCYNQHFLIGILPTNQHDQSRFLICILPSPISKSAFYPCPWKWNRIWFSQSYSGIWYFKNTNDFQRLLHCQLLNVLKHSRGKLPHRRAGHILSRIYNCTKHGNRPNDNATTAHLHCIFRFYNCTNCDQLHVKICPVVGTCVVVYTSLT